MFGAVPSTLRVIVTIVIVVECRAYVISEPEPLTVTPVGRHTGIWAIKFKASSEKSYSETAEQYAIQHDLINKGVVGELEDTYEFVLPSKQQGLLHKRELLDEYASKLMNDHVHWFEHQQVLKRTSRALMFDDPEYELQWHLHNKNEPLHDLNVMTVWSYNITGRGATVCVVDDGVEQHNPDIERNFVRITCLFCYHGKFCTCALE